MTKISFNPEQQQAVEAYKGAFGVVSGAGQGKTAVLMGRTDNLIKQYKIFEKDILILSFTRNTADELKKKLDKMGHKHVNVGTFHSICGRILFQEGIEITGYNLIKEWQIDNCFKAIDQKADVKEIMNFISFQKNYMRSYKDAFVSKDSEYPEDQLRVFFKAYEELKKKKKLYDFDDYLLMCLKVLQNNPGKYTYEYILVDEHQDTNLVQNLILEEWCKSGNMFTVFDPKQAIYSFRSGNVEYSMNFEKYWSGAKVINLYTNYRSTNNIVEQSNHFIRDYFKDYEHYVDAIAHSKEDGHISVHSHVTRDVEAVEVADKIEELIASGESLNEIAVLYRMNKHANFIEAELKRRDVEYDIANDSSFFKRKEIAGVIAYLRLIHNVHDDNAFEVIFKLRNMPLKFFSNKVFSEAQQYAGQYNMSLFEAFTSMSFEKPWQRKNAINFEQSINRLRMQADKGANVITLINNIAKVFQLNAFIKEKYSSNDEIEERIESINVLKSFVKGNNLEQFITYVYSNTNKKKVKKNAVRLMSIHRSKGLEFDNVFVVGVEDEQFPHQKSDLAEEARLFYVSVTRPRKNLWIHEIGKGNRFIQEYGIETSI